MDFKQALVEFNPMVTPQDLYMTSELLNFVKPKTILELGAGSGGWILAISKILDYDIKFIGYEDFRLDYNLGWPKNKEELTNYITKQNTNINVTINDNDIKFVEVDHFRNLNYKFDVVRLDCLEKSRDINELFFKIYPYTSDNCIFLVDDITPNLCPNRFLSYMDRVHDGLLKPLWFGKKEGAWCKANIKCNDIQDHILNIMSNHNIKGKSENIPFYNVTYRVILSW
jgi:hypothetical protein